MTATTTTNSNNTPNSRGKFRIARSVLDICAIVTVIVGIISMITALTNTDGEKIQKILLDQSRSLGFLSKVPVTDTIASKSDEFKICDTLQDGVELYFRICQQLSLPQSVESSDYTLDEEFEIYKNNLKLLNELLSIGSRCRSKMSALILHNKKCEYYFNFCDALNVLRVNENFSKEMDKLNVLCATTNDKTKITVQIRNFMRSADIVKYLEMNTEFMISSFNAVNIVRLEMQL